MKTFEIFARAWQELINLILTALPPDPAFDAGFGPRLPFPAGIAPDEEAQQTIDLANQIQRHQFPIFAMTIDIGPDIRWRRDYLRGIETGLSYFRRIPYLDSARSGDHKVIWELNRHQHLLVLARAYRLTGDARTWMKFARNWKAGSPDNPFHRGTNWASALEVAFRALSWIWVYHFVGPEMPCHVSCSMAPYAVPTWLPPGE